MMPYLVFRLCRTIKHYLEVSMHASIEPAATNWKWMANGRWEDVWRVHVQFVSARCYRWIEELSMQKKTLKHIYVLVFCFCYLNGQWTYFLTNFFFFMWLYDEARVLSIWFWGASFWIWKSCNMTFNHFGKFLVLGIQVTGFFYRVIWNLFSEQVFLFRLYFFYSLDFSTFIELQSPITTRVK